MYGKHGFQTFVLLTVSAGFSSLAVAQTCNVPSSSHATIQAAVDDMACSHIVLAAMTYVETPVINRSLNLQGEGSGASSVDGQIEVTAGAVQLSGLTITAPDAPLNVHSGAKVSGVDLEAVVGEVQLTIFADGFEGGTTSAWSSTTS